MHAFALDFTNILLTLELPWKDFPCGCICPVFCRTYVAQSVCGALLKHYKSTGSSQYSQDCHAHNITHSLVSDVMETAVSMGVKNTPVNSAGVLHLLSQYLSTVLPNSLLQLLQCTIEENEEVCMSCEV